jgi:hypothetical protein
MDGPTVLPVIKKAVTIVTGGTNPGFGDIIDASKYGRLFDVARGGSLSLQNVTLQNGSLFGRGVSAEGGAIYNQGTLVLSEVMVRSNTAAGFAGQEAAGGAIWSNGSLTVENSTAFQANSAEGGVGDLGSNGVTTGGNAFGGAIYIAGGTAIITGSTFGASNTIPPTMQFFWNTAQGGGRQNGAGGNGGSAYGGAIYVAGGTVNLSADNLGGPSGASGFAHQNIAQGGLGGYGYSDGFGYGGGLYVAGGSVTLTNDIVQLNVADSNGHLAHGGGIFIASGAAVRLDFFTLTNTYNNTPDNIDGTYILRP